MAWRFASWLFALALSTSAALAQDLRLLEAIDVQSLPGQRVELRLRMNGAAPEPMSFTIDDPATNLARPAEYGARARVAPPGRERRAADHDLDGGGQWPHARRAELELDGARTQTRVEGDSVYVTIGEGRWRPRRRRRSPRNRGQSRRSRRPPRPASARSTTSTSAADPMAPARSSSS